MQQRHRTIELVLHQRAARVLEMHGSEVVVLRARDCRECNGQADGHADERLRQFPPLG
jgi:hypothetical protein